MIGVTVILFVINFWPIMLDGCELFRKRCKKMELEDGKKRCDWCNLDNELYVKYHDEEWGYPNFDEGYLFEMLILESFQAGLSWETILKKRENFRQAFDDFDMDKIMLYDEEKIEELRNNKGIVRNRLKITAAINNARIFKEIQGECGSFLEYLRGFTGDDIIYENDKTTSPLSEEISRDLRRRGMTFVGPTIIYSYLQAIGLINSHANECFLYNDGS